jgi:hypothetical protein
MRPATTIWRTAANILLVLATVWQADLISGESLKSLKSEGRGREAKGR